VAFLLFIIGFEQFGDDRIWGSFSSSFLNLTSLKFLDLWFMFSPNLESFQSLFTQFFALSLPSPYTIPITLYYTT
jgi:hypothetical protein